MNVVNLVFDGWGKESGEPPGSHPGPQGRMDSVECFGKIFLLLCSLHEMNFCWFHRFDVADEAFIRPFRFFR